MLEEREGMVFIQLESIEMFGCNNVGGERRYVLLFG